MSILPLLTDILLDTILWGTRAQQHLSVIWPFAHQKCQQASAWCSCSSCFPGAETGNEHSERAVRKSESRASNIWKPHPSHTQQPPTAHCFKGLVLPEAFCTLDDGWLPSPTNGQRHKSSTACINKRAAAEAVPGECGMVVNSSDAGAFHQAFAVSSGSTINQRSDPATVLGRMSPEPHLMP